MSRRQRGQCATASALTRLLTLWFHRQLHHHHHHSAAAARRRCVPPPSSPSPASPFLGSEYDASLSPSIPSLFFCPAPAQHLQSPQVPLSVFQQLVVVRPQHLTELKHAGVLLRETRGSVHEYGMPVCRAVSLQLVRLSSA